MKEMLKGTAAAALFVALCFGPGGFVLWQAKKKIDFWYANYAYHKARNDYLFDGANARGLLDICVGPEGKPGVFFKEECRS